MKQRDMAPRQPPAVPGAAPGSWPVPEVQPLEPQLTAPVTVPVPSAGDPGAQAVPPRSLPLPQGGAMRRMALDLLYQNGAAQTAPGIRDHVDVPPPPPQRSWRERRLGRLLPAVEGEDDGLETDIEDWLVSEPAAMPAPGGGLAGNGKSGAGGARMARSGLAGLCSDAGPEDGDAPQPAAIVAATFLQPLRPPRMTRPGSLPALRPKSRAECERRCGSDGFCDPSDPLGCGGEHCGRR